MFADSQVVVDQMNGASRVHSHKLMAQYRRSRQLAGQFAVLSFEHIPREWNVLADAMAEDAVLRVEARSRNA